MSACIFLVCLPQIVLCMFTDNFCYNLQCWQIVNMQQKLTDLKKDAVSSSTAAGSEEKPTHTLRTLEYKLDRVRNEIKMH